jgi:mono/diheme cytochrome c family protein
MLIRRRQQPFEQPKGPGRDWTVEEAVAMADSGIDKRDIEHGKAMFAASLCIACHTMNGEGGVSGLISPNSVLVFSYKDMLESIH